MYFLDAEQLAVLLKALGILGGKVEMGEASEFDEAEAAAEEIEASGLEECGGGLEEEAADGFASAQQLRRGRALFRGGEAQAFGHYAASAAPAALKPGEQFLAFSVRADDVQFAHFGSQPVANHGNVGHGGEFDEDVGRGG